MSNSLWLLPLTVLWSADAQFQRQIKVGVLTPNNAYFNFSYGYLNIVGGLAMGMRRIQEEGLLPNFNFTFEPRDDQCSEKLAAGNAADLLEVKKVEVLIGPVCSDPAIIVAAFAKFYNVPMIGFGRTSAFALANRTRFSTTLSVRGPSKSLANAIVQLLNEFNWTQFAFLYEWSSVKGCNYIRDELLSVVSLPDVAVDMLFYKDINTTNITAIDSALDGLEGSARIVVLCFDDSSSKRRIFNAIGQKGLHQHKSFVFIECQYNGLGFYRMSEAREGSTGATYLWDNSTSDEPGLDNNLIKAVCENIFILQRDETSSHDLNTQQALQAAQSYPFYCTACNKIGWGATGIGDALYMYALGLNRTLTPLIANTQGLVDWFGMNLRVGTLIRDSLANVSFPGYSGNFTFDANSVRVSVLRLATLTSNLSMDTHYTISASVENATVHPGPAASTTWAKFGGKIPLAVPVCGFDGALCSDSVLVTYGGLIYGAIAAVALSVIGTGIYVGRGRYLEYQRLNAAWQVSQVDLVVPAEKSAENRSQHSIPSSAASLAKKEDTPNFSFYTYFGDSVAARKYTSKALFEAKDRAQFRMMRQIDHDNLAKFLGICTETAQFMSIWRYYHRGSIKDIISAGSFAIDGVFMVSLIRDIVNGLYYIHQSELRCHGHLNSSNCLVDERWVCKIADYGINCLIELESIQQDKLLYMAPELLNKIGHPLHGEVKPSADIYSLGIVAAEIVSRRPAWESNSAGVQDTDELLYLIKRTRATPVRPALDIAGIEDLNADVPILIRDCWTDLADQRPTTGNVRSSLKSMGGRGESLMDHVFTVLEKYMNTLQEEVESRTKALVEEKKRSDVLLYRQIADNLKFGSAIEPESFDSVTVFFSDVVRFGELAAKSTPVEAITLLNDLFTMFDSVIETFDCYKVESVGDDTLVVSGLPVRNGIRHVTEIANMALSFTNGVAEFRVPHLPGERVQLRIGFHSGPCVAGVVGLAMPRYCLFGDTINTASRMCSNSRPGKIHLSADSNNLLKVCGGFVTRSRGELIIKGKGVMETFFLEGVDQPEPPRISSGSTDEMK